MNGAQFKLGELAELIDGTVLGDSSVTITGVSSVDSASEGHITYVAEPEVLPRGEQSPAAALIVPPELANSSRKPLVITEDPRLAFSKALALFAPRRRLAPGVHPTAIIGANVQLGEQVAIGAHAFVGDNVLIGDRVAIHPLAYVGHEVTIGDDTEIHPQTYIGDRVVIGNRCIIHPGAVIGADGFGYLQTDQGHHKIPQIGSVIIEDDVEVGANSTIDRATVSATRIGKGTKIDDQCHIAHNCVIGEHCLLCGQVGIAGSAKLGNGVILGGQVGVNDHITIHDGIVIGAGSGVFGTLTKPGVYSGMPARPHHEDMRTLAAAHRLPRLIKRVKELEKRLDELEGRKEE